MINFMSQIQLPLFSRIDTFMNHEGRMVKRITPLQSDGEPNPEVEPIWLAVFTMGMGNTRISVEVPIKREAGYDVLTLATALALHDATCRWAAEEIQKQATQPKIAIPGRG